METVQVDISPVTSFLDYRFSVFELGGHYNIPATNFRIRGDVRLTGSNSSHNIYASVTPNPLYLKNDDSQVGVNFYGTIGGIPISQSPVRINFVNKHAGIDLRGDIDESTLSYFSKNGPYRETLVITCFLL